MTVVNFPESRRSEREKRWLSRNDMGIIGVMLLIAGVAYFGIYTVFDMRFAQQDRELERIVNWGETMAPNKLISP